MATGHGCRHQGFDQSENNQHTRRLINTRRHLKPPGSSQLWLIWDGSLLFSHLHESDRNLQEDFHFPFPQLKKGIFNWMFWKLEEQTTLRHLPKVSDFTDTSCACWFHSSNLKTSHHKVVLNFAASKPATVNFAHMDYKPWQKPGEVALIVVKIQFCVSRYFEETVLLNCRQNTHFVLWGIDSTDGKQMWPFDLNCPYLINDEQGRSWMFLCLYLCLYPCLQLYLQSTFDI